MCALCRGPSTSISDALGFGMADAYGPAIPENLCGVRAAAIWHARISKHAFCHLATRISNPARPSDPKAHTGTPHATRPPLPLTRALEHPGNSTPHTPSSRRFVSSIEQCTTRCACHAILLQPSPHLLRAFTRTYAYKYPASSTSPGCTSARRPAAPPRRTSVRPYSAVHLVSLLRNQEHPDRTYSMPASPRAPMHPAPRRIRARINTPVHRPHEPSKRSTEA
ncbi:hypothetical protein DENSPDRAFT_615504 [Dentipellis sp. KUC8613]|nr:hypothetical protein DENSPDRAFT_615504 [Dentipellis sp. KUC8613]